MVTQRKNSPSAARLLDEVETLVRSVYPDAEIEVHRIAPREYDMRVYGDCDDMFDVLDVTSPRTSDILVDHGVFIHVLPLGRRISRS
jgi:hypothetical protein